MMIIVQILYSYEAPINLETSKSRANMHVFITFQAFLYKIINLYNFF